MNILICRILVRWARQDVGSALAAGRRAGYRDDRDDDAVLVVCVKQIRAATVLLAVRAIDLAIGNAPASPLLGPAVLECQDEEPCPHECADGEQGGAANVHWLDPK